VLIYLGMIRPGWGDTGDAHATWAALDNILAVIPWAEVPLGRREQALDRLRPIAGEVRYLVILRDGREVPTAVEAARKVKKAGASQRRGQAAWLAQTLVPTLGDPEEGLQESGWATVKDLAEATGYNVWHLRHLAREGQVPAHKVGQRWWIHKRGLEIYAAGRHPSGKGRRGAKR
jgi:hypothetical protein